MKFENNDDEDFMKNSRPLDPNDEGIPLGEDDEFDPEFKIPSTIAGLFSGGDKPLGITWSEKNIVTFLERKGYEFISREDVFGDVVKMAYKPGCKCLPDHYNIREVFSHELQLSIIDFLTDDLSIKIK